MQVEEKTAAEAAAAAVLEEARAAKVAQAEANKAGLQRAEQMGKAHQEAIENLQVIQSVTFSFLLGVPRVPLE